MEKDIKGLRIYRGKVDGNKGNQGINYYNQGYLF
jgi:hypothetical protein